MADEDGLRLTDTELLHATLHLWDMTLAFVKPFALKAAILLQIPDILASAGPDASLSLSQIIERLPTHTVVRSDYLSRILRFLVVNKVFEEIVEEATAATGKEIMRYRLTPVSKLLVKNSPVCFSPVVLMQTHEVIMAPFHHFHEVVLEGGYAFTKAHGKDFWEFSRENEVFNSLFTNAMAAMSKVEMRQVLGHYYVFKYLKSLADVGGGLGETTSQIIAAYPHIQAINFDLPHVITVAPVISGVKHIGGNMFEGVPTADAILMKHILHDWDDNKCTELLGNCHKALPHDGKLIIIDRVLNSGDSDEKAEFYSLVSDLIMIGHCSGGKERSEEQWRELLNAAGFKIEKILHLALGLGSVIEACKATTKSIDRNEFA